MNLTEKDWGGMDWIDLAPDRNQWPLWLVIHPRFYLGTFKIHSVVLLFRHLVLACFET
jgi:hypothetical protein